MKSLCPTTRNVLQGARGARGAHWLAGNIATLGGLAFGLESEWKAQHLLGIKALGGRKVGDVFFDKCEGLCSCRS